MEEGKQLYTTAQAAKMLGISANHMRGLISTGKAVPYLTFGGTHAFTATEIERVRARPDGRGRPVGKKPKAKAKQEKQEE